MPLLADLLDAVEVIAADPVPADVTAVTHDSRAVVPGALFCCVPGTVTDGHVFAADAVALGATALLVEHRVDVDVPQVVVPDVRVAMGRIAAAFHGHPSEHMDVVGVTGTNGKTTTTWLLQSIFRAAGREAELIGTLTGARTTPESTELQDRLASFRARGVDAVAMEVSSHALALSRVEGTRFAVGVFTNLSRDHLDFHASMEDYFAAKARLFEPERAERAVVNVDDPHGRLLLEAARVPTVPYSLADVEDLQVGVSSSTCTWRGARLRIPLGGAFNVGNALAAATAAAILDIEIAAIAAGLDAAPPIPGRFEPIDAGQPFDVIVDYAHTPDGLDQLLRAIRPVTPGRVIAVFGAGGDRDPAKRPLMGEVVARLADVVVVTADNPRSEDPAAIAEAIVAGMATREDVTVELDRRAAIRLAFDRARSGDTVVLAGKGHETTQTIGPRVLPFDDRVVAREELS